VGAIKMAKRKKTAYEKLYIKFFNKAEKLWKEIAFLRDGRQCQVQKRFPNTPITHSEVLQVDHWVTRNDHNLFFNPCNSLVVCSVCNGSKGWNQGPARELINIIVRDREQANAGLMLEIHMSHQPNILWKDVEWLEKQVIPMLEDYKQKLKGEYAATI
jgi:hypothetical protein